MVGTKKNPLDVATDLLVTEAKVYSGAVTGMEAKLSGAELKCD